MIKTVSSMRVSAYNNLLNISPEPGKNFSFDGSGRLFAVHDHDRFIRRGCNGSMVASTWKEGTRRIEMYLRARSISLEKDAGRAAGMLNAENLDSAEIKTSDQYSFADLLEWVQACACFDLRKDAVDFHAVYAAPVGILPPDQYLPVVIQVSEGCAWNGCSFCRFYKDHSFRKKSFEEISAHIKAVKKYFGKGISVRNSVFLGEANGITYKSGQMINIIEMVKREMEYLMPDFRGICAFMEPSGEAQSLTSRDFKKLGEAGLSFVYIGLESGSAELRSILRKPCSVSAVVRVIREAKQGGISIGLILMLGVGGKKFAGKHVTDSIQVIRRLNLDSSDMIFLSPLDGAHEMSRQDMVSQCRSIQQGLPPGVRSSLYEIQGFVY